MNTMALQIVNTCIYSDKLQILGRLTCITGALSCIHVGRVGTGTLTSNTLRIGVRAFRGACAALTISEFWKNQIIII